jgi:HEAT repeat protein
MQKVVAFSFLLAACSADDRTTPQEPAQTQATPTTASSSVPWRDRVAAELAAMDPARRAEYAALAPQSTRAGGSRFTTDVIHDPLVAAVFIDRLAKRTDAEEVRVALAEALPRTGGLYADAVADLVTTESSATVRAVYVHGARRAPAEHGLAILRRGFADGSTEVRAEAARTAAAHAAGAQLAGELRAVLHDSDPALRSEAARSLGILKIEAARDELVKALGDGVAEVRLESMRALDRIAPGSLAGTAMVTALMSDPDDRVSRLAQKLAVKSQ